MKFSKNPTVFSLKKFILKYRTLIWFIFQSLPFFIIYFLLKLDNVSPIEIINKLVTVLIALIFIYGLSFFFNKINLYFIKTVFIFLSNLQKFLVILVYTILLFILLFYSTYSFYSLFVFIMWFIFIRTVLNSLDKDEIIISHHLENKLFLFKMSKEVIPFLFMVSIVYPFLNMFSFFMESPFWFFILNSLAICWFILIIQTLLAELFIIFFLAERS